MPAMNELKLCNQRRQYRGHGPLLQCRSPKTGT